MTVIVNVVKLHRDSFRDTRLLHRHTIQRVGTGHRRLGMGDDHELRPLQKFVQYVKKPTNVRFVQRAVHFVQHAEGTGAELEDR